MYNRAQREAPEPLGAVQINVYPDEPIDLALRRFKKVVQRSGLLQDYRRAQFFVPRSERRRLKSIAARKRRGA